MHHPVKNEKAATAYLEAAQAILRQVPMAQASASADEIPIRGRVPLPKKRPIRAFNLGGQILPPGKTLEQ